MTNVYTRPDYRGQGIGRKLLAHVVEWARAENLELLLVWPSDESVGFFDRAGFQQIADGMQLELRPYIK
jgi:GNAT superfamily N-acetyltransferase